MSIQFGIPDTRFERIITAYPPDDFTWEGTLRLMAPSKSVTGAGSLAVGPHSMRGTAQYNCTDERRKAAAAAPVEIGWSDDVAPGKLVGGSRIAKAEPVDGDGWLARRCIIDGQSGFLEGLLGFSVSKIRVNKSRHRPICSREAFTARGLRRQWSESKFTLQVTLKRETICASLDRTISDLKALWSAAGSTNARPYSTIRSESGLRVPFGSYVALPTSSRERGDDRGKFVHSAPLLFCVAALRRAATSYAVAPRSQALLAVCLPVAMGVVTAALR